VGNAGRKTKAYPVTATFVVATAPVILLLAKRLTTEIHCRAPQHVASGE